jgi:hypothetical protein
MQPMLQVLQGAVGLGVLVCHIMVIVKMFQNGKSGLGIVTILTTCCGIGGLISLIYGWIKADAWNIKTLMIAFTVLWILAIVLGIVNPVQIDMSQFQQPQPLPPP